MNRAFTYSWKEMIHIKSDHIKDISLLITAFQPHMLQVLHNCCVILKSYICKCLMSSLVGATVQLANTSSHHCWVMIVQCFNLIYESGFIVEVLWICLVMMVADYAMTQSSIWPSKAPIVPSLTTTCAVLFLEKSCTWVVDTSVYYWITMHYSHGF